jgi:hypothetical protein
MSPVIGTFQDAGRDRSKAHFTKSIRAGARGPQSNDLPLRVALRIAHCVRLSPQHAILGLAGSSCLALFHAFRHNFVKCLSTRAKQR